MPSRPDLRELASNVKEAFAEMDRDTLLDILTFVVKEYVVEGPPPMLIHQAETLADLKNISFAQLITAMQTRFDFPELAMFVVDGEQVGVRIGGVVHPLVAQRTPAPGMQMIDTRPPAPAAPPPQPGVRVVETAVQQRPATPTQTGAAPPPARGLSVRGQPSGQGEAPARPPQAAPATPPAQGQPAPAAQPGQPAQPGAPQEKPEGSGDDASARFSLLELD